MKIESINYELQPAPHYILIDNSGRVYDVYNDDIAEYMHQFDDDTGRPYTDLERLMTEGDIDEIMMTILEAKALNSDTYKFNKLLIDTAGNNDKEAWTIQLVHELDDLIQSFAAHKVKVTYIPDNTLVIRSRHFMLFHNQTEYKIVNKLYV